MRNSFIAFLCLVSFSAHAEDKKPKPAAAATKSELPAKIEETDWLKWRLLGTEIEALTAKINNSAITQQVMTELLKKKQSEQLALRNRLWSTYKFGQGDNLDEEGVITRAPKTDDAKKPAKTEVRK